MAPASEMALAVITSLYGFTVSFFLSLAAVSGFFTVAVSVFTTRVSRSWAAENEKAEVTRVSMKKFLRIIKFYIWLKIENYTKTDRHPLVLSECSYMRSNSAIFSTWCVCGNISTGRIFTRRY